MDAKVVIDASVWVSRLILQEDHHEASDYWTRGFFAAGGKLVAPALLLLEVAAAMSRATRDASFAQEAVENLKN
ncbi:MAG TPA: hypothetical protein VKU38_08540, partial [Ktedonobacteraceae bacterium]|nr:hypothetical protein [Ktedonobacteraceae bacterium]